MNWPRCLAYGQAFSGLGTPRHRSAHLRAIMPNFDKLEYGLREPSKSLPDKSHEHADCHRLDVRRRHRVVFSPL